MPRSWILLALALSTTAFAGGKTSREDEILDAVRTESPERYQKLVALRESAPERYQHAIRRAGEVMALRASDPTARGREEEMKQLRGQIHDLANGAQGLDAKALAARRAQIEPLASRLFDLKLTERRAMLDMGDDHLSAKRDKLDEKSTNKQQIIDQRIDALLSGERRPRGHKADEGL